MDNNHLLGRLVVGTMINFVVLYILEQIDNKLAMLFLVVVALIFLITYRDQIFPSLNAVLAQIQGTL